MSTSRGSELIAALAGLAIAVGGGCSKDDGGGDESTSSTQSGGPDESAGVPEAPDETPDEPAGEERPPDVSADEAIAIFDRWVEATVERDGEALAALYTDDATVHPASSPMTIEGPDKIVAFFGGFADAYSKLHSDGVVVIARDGEVVSVARNWGVNDKPLMGMPATNEKTHFVGLAVTELRGDEIEKQVLYADNLNFMGQLGIWDGKARPADDPKIGERVVATREDSDAETEHVAAVERALEARAARDAESLLVLYADGAAVRDQSAAADADGKKAIAGYWKRQFESFPEVTISEQTTWAAGDYAVATYVVEGKNTGKLHRFAEPATGKPFRLEVADLYRFDGDAIAEHWIFVDGMSLGMQLGAMQVPSTGGP